VGRVGVGLEVGVGVSRRGRAIEYGSRYRHGSGRWSSGSSYRVGVVGRVGVGLEVGVGVSRRGRAIE
jgi:hypothetical protein